MSSTALFAGSFGPLLTTLMDNAAAAGEAVACADTQASTASWKSDRLHVPWSPRSPLSARSLTSACVNACGTVDRAVLVIAPARCGASLVDAGISEIERYLDDELRSVVYLSRELLRHLSAYTPTTEAGPTAGSLIIAVAEPEDAVGESMRSLVYGAVGAFLSTLLDHYRESGPPVYGFIGPDSEEQAGAYASFIETECRERAGRIRGRLQRYGKRTALRSLFRS
ncbi:MAG: hypothetical protein ACLFM0_08150 [Spirochaetales bacterium]